MARYNIYPGNFTCHICKANVKTIRVYAQTKELTWMCHQKHLSQVDVSTKKKKEDYEREE
jgi:hypothetical protein